MYNANALAGLGESNEQIKLNLKEMSWILDVSKLYRNDNLQIYEDIIFLDTEDGIYFSALSQKVGRNFSFVPALLNKSKPDTEVFLSNHLEVKSKPFRTFSALYKISSTTAETIKFAKQQKARMKVNIGLSEEKLVIKSLRAAAFNTSIADKSVVITTKDNEHLSLNYGKMVPDIAATDFEKFAQYSNILADIAFTGYPIHQLIANQKEVTLFITQYANIIRFYENCYLILRSIS